jgi:hypothetical protein
MEYRIALSCTSNAVFWCKCRGADLAGVLSGFALICLRVGNFEVTRPTGRITRISSCQKYVESARQPETYKSNCGAVA